MKKNRIFIVEDDKIVALDVKGELEAQGYEIAGICGESGEVIKMIIDTHPDVVLMDVNIDGDSDGIELAEIIMDRYNIPVIYVTSFSDAETLRRTKNTHPYGYILKPYEYVTVVFTIEMALSRHYYETKYHENSILVQTVFNSMLSVVLCVEIDGKISMYNEAALRFFSLTGEQLSESIFPEFFEMYTEDDNTLIKDFFNKCMQDENFRNTDIKISVGGKFHLISMNISPILAMDGTVQRYVIIFTDITGKKKEEKEKIKSQKLESLSILAGGIAHDFNNLLTSIIGNISLLKISHNGDINNSENRSMMEDIEKSAIRAQRLTQQLFTFSKGSTAVRKTTDIKDLLRDVSGFVLSGSNLKCVAAISDDLYPVEIDEGQISQVIQNLFLNAMQTMPDGGNIELKAENINLDKSNEYMLNEGDYIYVSIKDHGCGIKPDIVNKIFDPYFSTKIGGSGMGLASCLSIIKAHSGYIGVKSVEKEGSDFFFIIPKSGSKFEPSAGNQKFLNANGYILFLDDEENVRSTASKILNALGFNPVVFEKFDQLYSKYRELILQNERIYAIILDYTLPGENYILDSVSELKKLDEEIKIIISSGYTNDTVLTDYAKYGFSAFLSKPYTVENLRSVLKHLY
ncbi:MAG: response regulator [Spirochaetes bacterium]|nr:response regulator [Spirochaetota bacterium]